eukprot:CAMPEP_0197043950 /NCGR_PEP_ID=MMETSP1384-20130603/20119_1 /TAXON_ID=29189 /ORGANISM="Ammonia sp." /LENGTH=535 /DNA_ID=CAMNT_0042475327 /DNA_START=35 /DNA_END=1642 /DNA_ORIENTATION=+
MAGVQQLFAQIEKAVGQRYPAAVAKFCTNYYVQETFDEDGVRDDINDCDYEQGGDSSAVIDALAESEFKASFASTAQQKTIARILKNAIANPPKFPDDDAKEASFNGLEDLKWTLQKSEPKAAKDIMQQSCPGKFETDKDQAFMDVLAVGKKNNVPMMIWLFDTYSRYRLNQFYLNGQVVQTLDFHSKYHLFRWLQTKSKRLVPKLESAISSFERRLCPTVSLTKPVSLIEDDINKYADYFIAMQEAVSSLVKNQELGAAPCQIDLWIIPKGVCSGIDDEDDPDEEDPDDDVVVDRVGKLKYRLDANKYKYSMFTVDQPTVAGIKRSFVHNLQEVLKKEGRNQRCIVYVDRRDENGFDKMADAEFLKYVQSNYGQNADDDAKDAKDKGAAGKDRVYVVQPAEETYRVLPTQFRSVAGINMSSSCMLPHIKQEEGLKNAKRNQPFGAKDDLNGYQFTLSWHVESEDVIRCYWYTPMGQVTRLFPGDIARLWPMQFHKFNKLNKERSEKLQGMQQITDPNFVRWYQASTKKDILAAK